MKSFALVSLLACLGSAIQVNYYKDGGCSDYATSIKNVPSDGSCYNYEWNGSNSANIANCDWPNCECIFFTDGNCQNPKYSAVWGSDNCASNWGGGFHSFTCIGFEA
ncbi:hypothetical protein GGS26DRAFT_592014 [Hypomontagnella submonticulosa]|nr:hypothetical protein GGS26DRAFT_592014 [Hypomontagnella submonticulosa]